LKACGSDPPPGPQRFPLFRTTIDEIADKDRASMNVANKIVSVFDRRPS
jgi:hypothetical protein